MTTGTEASTGCDGDDRRRHPCRSAWATKAEPSDLAAGKREEHGARLNLAAITREPSHFNGRSAAGCHLIPKLLASQCAQKHLQSILPGQVPRIAPPVVDLINKRRATAEPSSPNVGSTPRIAALLRMISLHRWGPPCRPAVRPAIVVTRLRRVDEAQHQHIADFRNREGRDDRS